MDKNITTLICFLLSLIAFSQKYPSTKKTPLTITKHNISFQDDYTWLENIRSEEVTNWVNQQNVIVDSCFKEIKKVYNIASTIKEYDAMTSHSLPNRNRKYFYEFYRKEKNKAPSLFYMRDLDDEPIEIVNPNKIYPENNVTINNYFPSNNSKLLAYKISINGSDKEEIRFVNIEKNRSIDDVLKNVKFSAVSWNRDKGVFYKKNSNRTQFERDSTFQIYYHPIGLKQDDDKLVYNGLQFENYASFFTTNDKLFIIENNSNGSKNYYYADLQDESLQLTKFIENDITDLKLINYKNGRVYFSTKGYNWGEVRSFNLQNRKDENLVISQIYNNLLVQTNFTLDYIINKYKTLGKNYLMVYDYSGKFIRKIDVPNGYDLEMMYFDDEAKDLYFGVYSYVLPYRNFKINIDTGINKPFYSLTNEPKPSLFPANYFETITTTYKSRDNVDIPMLIVYKKGMKLNGNNPTLLKAYGGFGAVHSPNFTSGLLHFLEKGGVFAYAEIRGGGEQGLQWHKDGKGLKKMNTFNDFIDAAEFLIKAQYTCPNKLAITGSSQGGLLVGVAITQRPELFKVAVPIVGVHDLLRFEQYTAGKYWVDEYGNANKEADYKYMLGYSPYHNIKDDVNYPTTLIITSDNDDRVPPIHSYKFAAKLQNRAVQKNPIYLRTSAKAGHNGGSSTYQKHLNETSEFYSFLLYNLNR
jgi:prolyl oligopeptidase